MAIDVEILYFEGCPTFEPTRQMVERALAGEAGVELRLVDVGAAGGESPRAFLGSPTVLVNGRDIDPSAEATDNRQLCCRIVRDESGVRDTPPVEWLEAAIEQARAAG